MNSEEIKRLQPWAYTICVLWVAGRSVGEISKGRGHTPGTVRGIIHRRVQPPRQTMSIAQRQLLLNLMLSIRQDGGALPDRFFVARKIDEVAPNDRKPAQKAPVVALKPKDRKKEEARLKHEQDKIAAAQVAKEAGGAERRGATAAALESLLRRLPDSGHNAREDMDPKRIPSGARRYQSGVEFRSLLDGSRLGGLGSVDYERSGGGGGGGVPMSVHKLSCIDAIGTIRNSMPAEDYNLLEAVVDRDVFVWEDTAAGKKAEKEIIDNLRRSLDVVAVCRAMMTAADFTNRWGVKIVARQSGGTAPGFAPVPKPEPKKKPETKERKAVANGP